MKALSLLQPWASLIEQQVKKVETRSWRTNYRGELYIHASQRKINQKDLKTQKLMDLLIDRELCYGKIIAKCKLVDCIYMDEIYIKEMRRHNPIEFLCGQYEIGRYAWILEEIEPMKKIINIKGHLGIWNFEE